MSEELWRDQGIRGVIEDTQQKGIGNGGMYTHTHKIANKHTRERARTSIYTSAHAHTHTSTDLLQHLDDQAGVRLLEGLKEEEVALRRRHDVHVLDAVTHVGDVKDAKRITMAILGQIAEFGICFRGEFEPS